MTIAICLAAIAFLLLIVVKPGYANRGGRLFGLMAIAVFPLAAAGVGAMTHVEHATSTEFCLSCHPMQQYGRSLHIDDVEHVAATHYLNGRVDREHACYACHTNYTMFGGVKSKLRGLKHVYIQYLGKIPDKITLYEPYNNRECLHCHDGTRPFMEGSTHKSDDVGVQKIRNNEISCVKSGCHGTVHDVGKLDQLKFWPAEPDKAAPEKTAQKEETK